MSSKLFLCRYNREEVVRSLGKEVNLNPPLTLGQLPDTPEELLKLDQVSYVFKFFILKENNHKNFERYKKNFLIHKILNKSNLTIVYYVSVVTLT